MRCCGRSDRTAQAMAHGAADPGPPGRRAWCAGDVLDGPGLCGPTRPEIAAEAGKLLDEVSVPQTHQPGAEAEVDFADLWIDLAGVRTKVFLFTLRLSCSGWAVHKAFGTQGQEAFLDGHQHAFTE